MKIWELLEKTNKPYFKYGTAPASTPENFFTFNNIDTNCVFSSDNEDNILVEVYDVCYYTRDPEEIYLQINNFCKIAKQNDWIISEYPSDINVYEPGLLGRMVRVARVFENDISQ